MVNIIIPFCNKNPEDFSLLEAAMYSIKNQTYNYHVTTIVDDSPKENKDKERIISLYKKLGLKGKYLETSQGCSGPSIGRKIGLDYAKEHDFQYVMFLDSDDLLMPRAVEVLNRTISRTLADVVISPISMEDKNKDLVILPNKNNMTWLHGKIYRTAALLKHDIDFNENIFSNEDACFNTQVTFLLNKKEYIEESVYLWKYSKNSLTRKDPIQFFKKSSSDYIEGQCWAIKRVLEKGKISSNIIYTLEEIYYMDMICRQLCDFDGKSPIVPFYDFLILDLLFTPEIIEVLKNKKVKKAIYSSLKGSFLIDDKIFFFSKNFIEWLQSYNKELGGILF